VAASDLILRQAFIEYDRRETEELLRKYNELLEPTYRISKKTERTIKWYKKLLVVEAEKTQKKTVAQYGARKTLRTALLAALIAALLALSIFAIGKYTSAFDNVDIHFFSRGSHVSFYDNETSGILKVRYSYIPKGYRRIDIQEDENSSMLVYSDSNGNILSSNTQRNNTSIAGINTEGTEIKETVVAGNPALYVEANTGNILMLVHGEYNTIIIADSLSFEELVKMAETKHEKHFWEK